MVESTFSAIMGETETAVTNTMTSSGSENSTFQFTVEKLNGKNFLKWAQIDQTGDRWKRQVGISHRRNQEAILYRYLLSEVEVRKLDGNRMAGQLDEALNWENLYVSSYRRGCLGCCERNILCLRLSVIRD